MDTDGVIFVVEDDPGFNMMMTNYLTSKNKWEVHSFLSGEECLEKLELKPVIFLQDFDLPGINGMEVMKRVKLILPETEFIFLSAQTDIHVALETLKHGAFDYIMKDSNAKVNALNKIDQILRLKKLMKEKKNDQISKNILLVLTAILLIILIVVWLLRFIK